MICSTSNRAVSCGFVLGIAVSLTAYILTTILSLTPYLPQKHFQEIWSPDADHQPVAIIHASFKKEPKQSNTPASIEATDFAVDYDQNTDPNCAGNGPKSDVKNICYVMRMERLLSYWGPPNDFVIAPVANKKCNLVMYDSATPNQYHCDGFFGNMNFGFHPLPSLECRKNKPFMVEEIESPQNRHYSTSTHPQVAEADYFGTFRRDADLPSLYFAWNSYVDSHDRVIYGWNSTLPPHNFREQIPDKAFFMMHAISHGVAQRLGWLEALMRALPENLRRQVDGYGGVHHTHDGREYKGRILSGQKQSPEFYELMSHYKFAFVMENSNCQDYITEKYWSALAAGTIPIVDGKKTQYPVPAAKSVIQLKDFGHDINKVAAHIVYLNSNDTAYAEYMAWRTLPLEQLNQEYRETPYGFGFIRLCDQIYLPPKERVKSDPSKRINWWNAARGGGNACEF